MIVVIQGGSAVTVAGWIPDVEAVLMAWYPGVKGGVAIGETLFGDNNPSGKTPISWPVSEGQLYVGYEDSAVERAVRDLKGFDKILLDPGETQRVTIEVPHDELRYWDTTSNHWVFENIIYRVDVGASSRDIRLSDNVNL